MYILQGTPLRSESDTRQRDTSHLCCSFVSFIVLVIITSTSAYSMEPENPSISLHSGDMEQGCGLVTDIVRCEGHQHQHLASSFLHMCTTDAPCQAITWGLHQLIRQTIDGISYLLVCNAFE